MEPDKLDSWLDDALARYGKVSPRGGLEYRVLANLKAEETRRVTRRWWRAVVTVLAGTTAVFIWFTAQYWLPRTSTTARISNAQSQKSVSRSSQHGNKPSRTVGGDRVALANANEVHSQSKRPSSHVRRASAGTPKLDQFPSPHPLSEQEKLLLAYAQQATEPVSSMRLGDGRIKNLEIPPLSVDGSITSSLDGR